MRESFNNTCFPTSEEYLSFIVYHKEKWNCSKATSHWDERERGSTLCGCKHACVRTRAHLCVNIHTPLCVLYLLCMREHLQRHMTALTKTLKCITNMQNDSEACEKNTRGDVHM